MNRLEFLKKVGLGILAAPFIPNILEKFEKLVHLPRSQLYDVKVIDKEFALGFMISQEMIEDDIMYPSNIYYDIRS